MNKNLLIAGAIAMFAATGCCGLGGSKNYPVEPYPYEHPQERPEIALSPAMERVFNNYGGSTPQDNELYSQFKYSKLIGLDYNNGDGTITRRDPTRIVKANGKYYMWYTLRNTPVPQGADKATDVIPSTDWDLCDIGYATSEDGFKWTEQGIAVPRPAKPQQGWRSVSTPDILVWEGKYFLYYQAFSEISGKRGDDCPVAMSWADSPDGPWTAVDGVVVANGPEGTWDQYSIHDPQPIVMPNGKIYLYYKSDYNGRPNLVRSTGLAIADSPFGPFEKYELNPVMNSGHETQMFRFKEGVAAIMAKDGHEANTIQYAPDGMNFEIASIVNQPPVAAGIYDPDAFTGVESANGITWGISHIHQWGEKRFSFLLRFDCDLSLDFNDPVMKKNIGMERSADELLRNGINTKQRATAIQRTKEDLKK
ncbi:MAG: hypothetical protein SNG35_02230 [Rikenellaceae bacterium]